MALGTVLGSNIFNLLCITGAVAVVSPIAVSPVLLEFDIWLLLGVTALLIPMMLTGSGLCRRKGTLLVLLYGGFLVFQCDSVRQLIL
jgi:cation:H+ antiporter